MEEGVGGGVGEGGEGEERVGRRRREWAKEGEGRGGGREEEGPPLAHLKQEEVGCSEGYMREASCALFDAHPFLGNTPAP